MIHDLIDSASYMPHGYCLLWKPWLVALHAGSDLLIAAAYFAIPIAMLQFLWRRQSVEMKHLAYLFAAFIFWCGLTHGMSLATLWWPAYELQGIIKFATAAVSIVTAVIIFPLLPRALALPSTHQLKELNSELAEQIASRQAMVAELESTREGLERRVEERTEELRKAVDQVNILMRELAHRSKNLLAVVQSMARQTLRHTMDKQQFEERFMARLQGLGQAQEELVRNNWRGVEIDKLVASQLTPLTGGERVAMEGPAVFLKPEAAHHIGLALHELATNAIKHGALSATEGRVTIAWSITGEGDGRTLSLSWRETGVSIPTGRRGTGFGFIVLERIVPAGLGGDVDLRIDPGGVSWTLTAPLAAVTDPSAEPGG
jgi:two-component sensor histidine kinase